MNTLSTNAAKTSMTNKQALAVLHHLYDAYLEQLSCDKQCADVTGELFRRQQIRHALRVLTALVHGEPRGKGEWNTLCEVCYLRYIAHIVQEQDRFLSTWCCSLCRACLEAEGRLVEEEGQDESEEKGAVPTSLSGSIPSEERADDLLEVCWSAVQTS